MFKQLLNSLCFRASSIGIRMRVGNGTSIYTCCSFLEVPIDLRQSLPLKVASLDLDTTGQVETFWLKTEPSPTGTGMFPDLPRGLSPFVTVGWRQGRAGGHPRRHPHV